MKFVFLVHSLRKGGAERLVLEIASSEKFLNASITIVSWLDTMEYLEEKYAEIKCISLLKARDYKWLFSLKSSAHELRKILTLISPDCIFIYSHTVLWLVALTRFKTRYVNVILGFDDISKFRGLKKIVYQPLDILISKLLRFHIITPTEELAMESSKYFFFDKSKVEIIPNGIEIKEVYKRDQKSSEFIITMLGTLGRFKGQHFAIEAIIQVLEKHPFVKLKIIGEGILKDFLIDQVDSLKLHNNVDVLGRRKDAFEIMSDSDIFWHLSISEGMPLAVIEAMACGLPVIGFNVSGIRSVVIDGENGYLTEYGDLEKISLNTIELINSPETRLKMSKNSKLFFERKYTKNIMLQGYKEFIENLI